MRKIATVIAVLLGCGAAFAASQTPSYLAQAIADKGRPEADTKRDEAYKPAGVIAFAGVRPGMKVADFMPGDGYYSRIFSKIVGDRGYVYAYYAIQTDTPPARRGAPVGTALASYGNIGIVQGAADKFVTPEKLDLVWTGLTYHDLHEKIHFDGLDVDAVNKAVYAALNPGGIYIVLDRASRPGAGLSDLDTLYRIDEASVKSEIEAAGFQFVGKSVLLHNPADNHTTQVSKAQWDARPDQFLLKFRKPRH